jgi:ABC-type dipeptide/oligopeptide/nickel transport system permease subunit
MAKEGMVAADVMEMSPRRIEFQRFCSVFFSRWLVIVGLFISVLVIILAVFSPMIAPYDPNKLNLEKRLMQPHREHLLGTDALGRDTLSRIIYGSRASLMVSVGALFVATFIGVLMGLIAGYFGGVAYMFIMRFIDALMAFPMILLALVIAGLLGGGLTNIVLALGIGLIPSFARLMCGQVLSVKENDYIMAARAMGISSPRIMLFHIVPNCFPPLIVQVSLWVGFAILAEAGLSFLGVGIQPPTAAWGAMINDGYKYLMTNPVLSFAPGAAIMLVVFGFNMIGDGLRDALDPRLRGKL